MAVVQDTLETVLRLVGGQQYISQLSRVALAHQQLAQAQQRQAGGAMGAGAAGGGGGIGVGAAAAGLGSAVLLAGVYAIGNAIKSSTEQLVEYDKELIRIQAFQKDMGQSVPTAEITEFTRNLSLALGISQIEILKTQDLLARYNVSTKDAARDTAVLARVSQAIGVSMDDFARGIQSARRGKARELFTELNIPIKGVTGQIYTFNQLLELADLKTRNMQAGFSGLPKAAGQASAAFDAAKTSFGKLFEPTSIRILNDVAAAFQNLSDMAEDLRKNDYGKFFRDLYFGPDPKRMAAAQAAAAGTGGNRSERYLREISLNTGPQGPLGRATRGGGAFGEPGGGLRMRDVSQMIKRG